MKKIAFALVFTFVLVLSGCKDKKPSEIETKEMIENIATLTEEEKAVLITYDNLQHWIFNDDNILFVSDELLQDNNVLIYDLSSQELSTIMLPSIGDIQPIGCADDICSFHSGNKFFTVDSSGVINEFTFASEDDLSVRYHDGIIEIEESYFFGNSRVYNLHIYNDQFELQMLVESDFTSNGGFFKSSYINMNSEEEPYLELKTGEGWTLYFYKDGSVQEIVSFNGMIDRVVQLDDNIYAVGDSDANKVHFIADKEIVQSVLGYIDEGAIYLGKDRLVVIGLSAYDKQGNLITVFDWGQIMLDDQHILNIENESLSVQNLDGDTVDEKSEIGTFWFVFNFNNLNLFGGRLAIYDGKFIEMDNLLGYNIENEEFAYAQGEGDVYIEDANGKEKVSNELLENNYIRFLGERTFLLYDPEYTGTGSHSFDLFQVDQGVTMSGVVISSEIQVNHYFFSLNTSSILLDENNNLYVVYYDNVSFGF